MEPNISFYHAKLKVDWAGILINELNIAQERFIDSNTYNISLQFSPEEQCCLFKVGDIPIPFQIPCLIGDICHNLRASADFCWMGLHRSIHNKPNAKHTIPIADNVKGLVSIAGKAFEGEAAANISTFLTDVIKTHRDFERGGNKMFIALNELSNWQKHNMLIAAPMVTKLGKNSVIKSNDGSKIVCGGAAISNNQVPFAIGGTEAEFTYDSEPTLEIGMNVKHLNGLQPIIPTLIQFHQCATEIVNAFSESFGNPSAT